MKWLKVLVTLTLVTVCFSLISVEAFDYEEGFVDEYIYNEEERQNAREEILNAVIESSKKDIPQTRMDEIVENWERAGTAISSDSPYREVLGQLKGRYKYGDGGGGMYWGESKSTSGTVSVGVAFGTDHVNISLAYAPGMKMTSGGQYKSCPKSLWNKYVKLYSSRKYEVTKYRVYRKNKYDSGKGTFVRNEYISSPYSIKWTYKAI